MGCKQDKELYEPVVVNDKYDEHGVPKQSFATRRASNKTQFIPGFATKTSTVVHGYIRDQFINDHLIDHIIPYDLIELIYLFVKNNCTFILILNIHIYMN